MEKTMKSCSKVWSPLVWAFMLFLLVPGSQTKVSQWAARETWDAVDDEVTAERIALAVARPLVDAATIRDQLPLQAHEEGDFWVVLGDDPYTSGDAVLRARLYAKIRKRDGKVLQVTLK